MPSQEDKDLLDFGGDGDDEDEDGAQDEADWDAAEAELDAADDDEPVEPKVFLSHQDCAVC